jgi:serine/threonine-protein kinase
MATGGPQTSISRPALGVGDVVAAKYRITSVIGEGGMGTVFAAHHELLDVTVAIKVLSTDLTRNRSVTDRFLREARAVARLKSDHVVRVMDVGTLDAGQPYIVMELLEGEDLEHRIQRVKQLPIAESVDIILQALEAMSHAHAVGIVHRDLKPANLFLATTPDGREVVKVLDFGIAKLSPLVKHDGARSGALTGEHTMLGSPSYMSPEQVRDSSIIDHRADLWALGVILYEIVTGHEPFGGGSVGEIFGGILHSSPTPVRDLRPDAPPELQAAVERCLSRDAEDRFPNVAAMARALEPISSGALPDHATRMEQTLARARNPSDPAGPRQSFPSIRTGPRPPLGSSPGPASAPHVAFSRTDSLSAPGKETLSAPPSAPADQPDAARPGRSHVKLAVTGLLFGAAVAALGFVAVPSGHSKRGSASAPASASPQREDPPPAASSSAVAGPGDSPAAIPGAQSGQAAPAIAVPSVSSATSPDGSTSHPAAAQTDGHHPAKPKRAAPPAPPPAKAHATSPPAGGLPGVLESPD